MVSKRKVMLGVVVAVFAFSAITVASASATEFVFNKTGTLTGTALTSPVFATPGAGASWECTKEKISGTVTVLKTATQKVTVQYEGCSLLGMLLIATPAEYELNTSGAYKILKSFTMREPGGLCTINFPAQTVSKLTYANKPAGKIEIVAAVTKIKSSGSGLGCTYAEESNGTMEGHSLLELTGGTAEVK